jgi:hypothetical protein
MNILISGFRNFCQKMENISEMVSEHPFEVDLQKIYISYIRGSFEVAQVHEARLGSITFVDFPEDFWLEWISDSEKLPDDLTAQTLSSCLINHPSPTVLSRCIASLPKLIQNEWNSWTVFPPRPTATKSAVRYVETAIEKVGLWCDSGPFWDSVRSFYQKTEPNNPDAVRRIVVRQIKAVPMSPESRHALTAQLQEFELTHSLSLTTSIDSIGEKLWNAWSAMEVRSLTDPSVFPEMILKRKSSDPPEYIRSLHARSVFSAPSNPDYWLAYARNVDSSEAVAILNRAVRNNPYCGLLWMELIKAAKENVLDQSILMGTSALRDAPEKDPGSLHTLLVAEISLNRQRGLGKDQLRLGYQTALSIMQEMQSAKHVAAIFVSCMNFESHTIEDGYEFVVGVISHLLDSAEWESVRAAMTPLQWVQLGLILRKCSDDPELVRKMYSQALGLVADKYKSIILNDFVVFEESFGDMTTVINLHQQLVELGKQAERMPLKKEVRKRDRDVEHTEKPHAEKKRMQEYPFRTLHQTRYIYMRDIPFSISEDALTSFLETECGAGRPKQVLIVRDDKGKSRGFGYAEFDSVDQANRAIEKSGTKLKSREVVIAPSDREITVKRDRPYQIHESREENGPVASEEPKQRYNDYFRNLISRKQKLNS